MLAVLGGLADVERDLIRTRTAEGRSRAKARGKHMGGTAERGHQTARAGRYPARIGRQLRPERSHHAPRHPRRMSQALGFRVDGAESRAVGN
jgi:Resolvase, N terminal domain